MSESPTSISARKNCRLSPKKAASRGQESADFQDVQCGRHLQTKHELAMIAADAIGDQTDLGYVIYCDTGKFCTAWSLMLADIGYVHSWTKKGPAVYDGSMEEWTERSERPGRDGRTGAK